MCYATEINYVSPKLFGSYFWLEGGLEHACITHHQIHERNVCFVLLRINSVLPISRKG
jgi:hypothetical protein